MSAAGHSFFFIVSFRFLPDQPPILNLFLVSSVLDTHGSFFLPPQFSRTHGRTHVWHRILWRAVIHNARSSKWICAVVTSNLCSRINVYFVSAEAWFSAPSAARKSSAEWKERHTVQWYQNSLFKMACFWPTGNSSQSVQWCCARAEQLAAVAFVAFCRQADRGEDRCLRHQFLLNQRTDHGKSDRMRAVSCPPNTFGDRNSAAAPAHQPEQSFNHL